MVVSTSSCREVSLNPAQFNAALSSSHFFVGAHDILALCASEDEAIMSMLQRRDMHIEDLLDVIRQFLLLGYNLKWEILAPFWVLSKRFVERLDYPGFQALRPQLSLGTTATGRLTPNLDCKGFDRILSPCITKQSKA